MLQSKETKGFDMPQDCRSIAIKVTSGWAGALIPISGNAASSGEVGGGVRLSVTASMVKSNLEGQQTAPRFV